MHEAHLAEWLLAQLTSRKQATAIIGDLLEQRGIGFRFWSSFARIVLSFALRSAVSFGMAFVSGAFCLSLMLRSAERHLIYHRWTQSFLACSVATLWIIAVYFAVRLGLGNQKTRVAFPLGFAGLIGMRFQWTMPVVSLISLLGTCLIASWALASVRYRLMFFSVLGTLPFAIMGWLSMFLLADTVGPKAGQLVPLATAVLLCAYSIFVLSAILPCGWIASHCTRKEPAAVDIT